jgi:glycosyltransferase involved in cell wall biosynthesis
MLCGIRQQPDATVTELLKGNLKKLIFQMGIKLEQLPLKRYNTDNRYYFSADTLGHGVFKKINRINPDIVHIHWVNHGFMALGELAKLKMPVVISCHDMWYFTGGCHYDEECGRFKTGCGSCPALGSNKAVDLSSRGYEKRKRIYRNMGSNLTLVGLSRWMAQSATDSGLLASNNVVHLPNGIDTSLFKPVDKFTARDLLGLPQDMKLILFGAVDATSDIRKGYQHLREALLAMKSDAGLIVFGDERNTPKRIDGERFKEFHVGNIKDEITLTLLYNAADISIVPSRQENLPNVIMESMACGTPVVAFNVGGNCDMIDHDVNGYLASPFDPHDMAAGIDKLLSDNTFLSEAGQKSREKILSTFDISKVAQQYIDLYRSITDKQK